MTIIKNIIVNFKHELNFDLENNQLIPYNDEAEDFLESIYGLDIFYNTYWERSCKDVEPKKMLELYNTVNSVNDDYIYYLNQSYVLKCDENTSEEIVNNLNDNIFIESIYIEPEVEVCVVPDYSSSQIYLDEVSGLNIRQAWQYSTGTNVKIGLIEFGFNKNHIELSNINIGIDFPNGWTTDSNIHHGTATLGIVGAINNGAGITGIAYNSNIYFSSIYNGISNAILYLITNCGFTSGDVISMSIAYKGSGTIERDINVYNSIKYATLLGITVCISAGNDSLDLNNLSFYENNPLLNPNLPQNDSGSIVVGGGSITRSRCSYSNYGTRVNVQGLGEQVVTSGYGNLYSIDGINSYYTGIFDGTSSACPMIAGGIVLIQSYIKNLGLSVLKPLEIRNLLNKISFTQTGDLTKNIGVMPNIYGIINYIQESNFSPIAINDNITTFPNVPININVLNNDIKFDSNEILLTNVSQGIYGTTSINPDKTIKYIPNNNFVGVDNFTYTISDINGGTTTAIVFIDISGTIIDNNNNQLEEGEIDMAKKYVQEKQLKTGSIAEFRVLSDNNFSDEYKNKIDTNVMQRFSMTTSTSIISFILKTNTPQKIYVNFGDGGNGVFDCDSGGCTITHTMENTPLSNEWTVIVESKDISYLDCNNNNLTSLDVSGLTNLATLNCSGNSLTSLEATGLTNLTNLTGLDCSYISLTSLDATGLTNLTVLTCGGGNLTSLDVSGLINLTQLDCSSSSLTSLDASGLTNLTALDCSYSSSLTSLDVTGLTNLTYLYCRSNNLTSLDVSGLTNLTYLECWSNNLTSLDVIGLTNLTYLDCYINNLTSLDVTGLTNLTYLNCRGNNLTVTKGNETLTSLVTRVGKTPPTGDVDIKYQQVGTIAVNESIATAKNWMVS